jgi:hypothetical protein
MAESIFQTYLNRLTDLSSKNRSLYLAKLEGSGSIDLRDFDYLHGEQAFEIIRKAIQGKKQIPLIPEVDPRVGETNQLSKSLSRLAWKVQLVQEETGDQSLYLAWPFVEGKLISGQVVRMPILLMPMNLVAADCEWRLSAEEAWEWNPAFLLAYRHAYGKELDTAVLDDALANGSNDPTVFRTQLSKIISENFHIQLSSGLFEDQIAPFPISQISLDQDKFQDGKLTLRTYAVLGQFGQKNSFLFRDYEELDEVWGGVSMEDLFSTFFGSAEKLPIPREEQLFPVFPLDASQENVLFKVRQGNSLVVEGPPGTGKSQLVANLVSDFIARGKKVLVVSQKRAALDVVYERMEKAGFEPFLGLVHDYKTDQILLFEKIRKQIEAIDRYQDEIRGIDSMQLEREISRLSARITSLASKFEELRQNLFDDAPAGLPIKAMYQQAELGEPAVSLSGVLLKFNFSRAQEFERDFRIYKSYQKKFSGSFWENRVSFALVEPADFIRIRQTLREIEKSRQSAPSQFDKKGLLRLIDGCDPNSVIDQLVQLQFALRGLPNPKETYSTIFSSEDKNVLNMVQQWLRESSVIISELSYALPDDVSQLEGLVSELKILTPKSSSLLGIITTKLNKGRYPLTFQTLSTNDLQFTSDSISQLLKEATRTVQLHEEFLALPALKGVERVRFTKDSHASLLQQVDCIAAWVSKWAALGEIQYLTAWESFSFEQLEQILSELTAWRSHVQHSSISWRMWLSNQQIREILDKGLSYLSLDDELTLSQALIELSAYDRFLTQWGAEDRELAFEIERQFGGVSIDTKISAFWNGWYLAWIGELERRNPVLAEAGSLKLMQEMEELKNSILEKRKISHHIALLRLREQMSSQLEYNRLGNRITYRELHHQVSKKRMRWPLRRLISELKSEVFRLLPCWLASPETVSALFPLGEKFDLVIFDEASQCQVERGLQAMLRGHQVVVAGDSKQLRPSDFYQIRWESEAEGLEHEAESLLELAGYYFEKHQLKGHYRSADPALIHFSNAHFYDRQLETLPDYQTAMEGKTPFTWEKTEGIWENQINKTDADAVVEKVKIIRIQAPHDSIGIVTGNYFQMELVREKLWKAGIQERNIKVRNIENVQGDEFDQVILSLGYAANREGKLVTNFGLLGKSGAENRLNVAITRARKMLHVISSVDPEDFRPGQLLNPGLMLLRDFFGFVRSQANRRDIPPPDVRANGYQLEWSLKNRLLKADTSLSNHIPSPVMDLVKSELNSGQIAILTDDQRFFNAPTAKSAMACHPILLENKGWKWEWRWTRGMLTSK